MNVARIDIAPELIADWLCLPKGNRITGVWLDRHPPHKIVLWVEGPDMPQTEDGEPVPTVTPTYRRVDHELLSFGVGR